MATPSSSPSTAGDHIGDGSKTLSLGPQVVQQIPFQDLCTLLERISNTTGTERKKRILTNFLDQWRQAHKKLHPDDADTTPDTFYAIMRLLLPQVDNGRPAYGMKETALAKHYIEVLNIAKTSMDAQKLLHYRAPTAAKQDAGDFASVAYFVLKNRCPEKGSLMVSQVNEYLDDLAMSNTKKDRAGMRKALQLLLRNTSSLEQKWLIRIILKELKTGLSENSVLNVFHPDAVDLFSVCSSLEKVCNDLRDLSVHLNEASISYFNPFRPMLGQRAAIDQVMKLMEHQQFYIETKFDGDRMQLHKQGNQYRYFSRSSKDYTSSFGGTQYEGSFTPQIHDCFNSKVKSCILDGEMVGWDPETESFLPKGENVDVKALGDYDGGAQQCFVVFDVLMVNDTNLANCPLKERAEQLKKIFQPIKGCIHLVDRLEANTKEEVVASLNDAIDRREEGLIIKQPSSLYRPDKRKGSGWLKIKPEYVDSLSDQLDVIIIGGYFGVGRRAGMVSHFMCGVAVPPEMSGERPKIFHSFCKVGSGYSLAELRDLGMKLKPHWRRFNTKNPPDCVLLAPGFKEKPDMWIEPWNSQIVQIRAAEIVPSDRYKSGCTLRFPRVEKVRDDKEWYDCMTVDELEQLKMVASGRLTHSHFDDDSEMAPPSKRRKVATSRIERPRGVAEQFRRADVSGVKEVSNMFEGKEFCVVNAPKELSKQEMERKIVEHGGTFVQNPGPDTFCVLVNKVIVRASSIISTGLYDVIKCDWFLDCLSAGMCLPFNPSHMLHTSAATAKRFLESYDQYGDSFIDDIITDETLAEVFKKVQTKHGDQGKAIPMTREEIAMIEERYMDTEDAPRGLFRQYKFYLDNYFEIGNPTSAIPDCSLDLIALDIKLHGGEVTDCFTEDVTHVVFCKSDLSRLTRMRYLEKSHKLKHHFITSDWVSDSIDCEFLKNERLFEPKTS